MLIDQFEAPPDQTPAERYRQYLEALEAVVAEVGVETASAETGIDAARLETLPEDPDLSLEEAASIVALSPDRPDAETVLFDVRDHVLMQMSSAVLDVDAIAIELDGSLSGQEIQQKIEGRARMTLEEYARISHLLAEKNPYQ